MILQILVTLNPVLAYGGKMLSFGIQHCPLIGQFLIPKQRTISGFDLWKGPILLIKSIALWLDFCDLSYHRFEALASLEVLDMSIPDPGGEIFREFLLHFL